MGHIMSFMSFHVIWCQFHYWSFHVISCHFMSFHVISCHWVSNHVISFGIGLFRPSFNKVGAGEGEGQICLPKPLATASLSGRRQKDMLVLTCVTLCAVVAVPYAGLLKLKITMVTAARRNARMSISTKTQFLLSQVPRWTVTPDTVLDCLNASTQGQRPRKPFLTPPTAPPDLTKY
jgi:hypothetical protein